MLRRVLHVGPLVAAPVAMTTFITVYAAEGEKQIDVTPTVTDDKSSAASSAVNPEQDPVMRQFRKLKASQKDKRLLVSQLPLYGEPKMTELVYVPEKEEAFRQHASAFRKAVWNETDRFEGAWNFVKKNYRTTKKYSQEFLTYLQEDSGALPRAAFITVTGLGGIVAGYKGGVIRKTLYAGVGMTGAASVCYAEQAVDISRKGWILTKQQAEEMWKQARSGTKNVSIEKATDKSQTTSKETKSESNPTEEKTSAKDTVKVASKEELKSESEPKKDFGMSKEEDKSMYSTRTS